MIKAVLFDLDGTLLPMDEKSLPNITSGCYAKNSSRSATIKKNL